MHVFEITVRGDVFKVESYLVETGHMPSPTMPSPRSRVPYPVESTAMAAALRAAGYKPLHLQLDTTFSVRNGWGKTLGEEAKGLLHHSEPDSRTRVCTTGVDWYVWPNGKPRRTRVCTTEVGEVIVKEE